MLRFLLQGTCYKGRIKVVDVDEGLKTTSLVPGLHKRCEMRTYMWTTFGWYLDGNWVSPPPSLVVHLFHSIRGLCWVWISEKYWKPLIFWKKNSLALWVFNDDLFAACPQSRTRCFEGVFQASPHSFAGKNFAFSFAEKKTLRSFAEKSHLWFTSKDKPSGLHCWPWGRVVWKFKVKHISFQQTNKRSPDEEEHEGNTDGKGAVVVNVMRVRPKISKTSVNANDGQYCPWGF